MLHALMVAFAGVVHHSVVHCCAIAHSPDYLSYVLLQHSLSGAIAVATLLREKEVDLYLALVGCFVSNHLAGDLEVTVGVICEQNKCNTIDSQRTFS